MKTYYDSSVLIAAFVEEEQHHPSACTVLGGTRQGFTSQHALAEIFATLTGGRLGLHLTPAEAGELVEVNVLSRLQVLELTTNDYRTAIASSHAVGARGGAIFDLLHLQAARRCNAERILTINVRHFQAFAPDLEDIISLP